MVRFGFAETLDLVRSWGLRPLLRVLWGHFVWRKETKILGYTSLDNPIPCVVPSVAVTIRSATLDDLDRLQDLLSEAGRWQSIVRLREWILRGDLFLIAEHNAQIVGYVVAQLQVLLRDRPLLQGIRGSLGIRDGDAWGAEALVRPSYRGKRIYPALSAELYRRAKEAGVRRILRIIDVNNVNSLAAHRRHGTQRAAYELSISRFLFFKSVRWKRLDGDLKNDLDPPMA